MRLCTYVHTTMAYVCVHVHYCDLRISFSEYHQFCSQACIKLICTLSSLSNGAQFFSTLWDQMITSHSTYSVPALSTVLHLLVHHSKAIQGKPYAKSIERSTRCAENTTSSSWVWRMQVHPWWLSWWASYPWNIKWTAWVAWRRNLLPIRANLAVIQTFATWLPLWKWTVLHIATAEKAVYRAIEAEDRKPARCDRGQLQRVGVCDCEINPLNTGSNFIHDSSLTQKLFYYQHYQVARSKWQVC